MCLILSQGGIGSVGWRGRKSLLPWGLGWWALLGSNQRTSCV